MFCTYPSDTTSTSGPHACASALALSFACAFALEPHTTTICCLHSCPPHPSWSCRLSPNALAILRMPPTPSPPPTTSVVGKPSFNPNSRRTSSLDLDSACQKPLRSGKPCWRIWFSLKPSLSAMLRMGSEGTKHKSTRLSNHVGCAPPKSVTTVQKGMSRLPPTDPISWSTRKGMSWHKGCTLTTKSGALASMHCLKLSKHERRVITSCMYRLMGIFP
mmetsp:Transcript_45191/g.76807  ORF Transcript_45191/g.76807 Transcript_45191/m.76807 type:complete len:218 (+) Transcript_45191:796-1449(+)